MERQKKRVKQRKSEKQGFEKRSPLQHLNGLQFHKPNTKKTSNLSSYCAAASVSVEAPNACVKFLLSSDASLASSSSSRAHLDRKPKIASRSKENEVTRKPLSEKSKKKQQPCLDKRQCGTTNTKPTYKTAQRSKLSCGQVKVLKKESQVLKSSRENGDSDISVKTPPVEASVSPEIPCGSHTKMLVLRSAATPICYGAGHLLSGVTDKRKCRRRGSLRGGEKVNLFDDEQNDENVVGDSLDCSVPLLAEKASVRWLLSPCDETHEDQGSGSEKRLDQCKTSCGNASLALDLLSSPSTLCGNVTDLGCENSNYNGSGSVGDAANQRKARTVILSPQENFQCFLGHSNKKMDEPLLAATPNLASNCNSFSSGEGKNERENVIGNSSAFSLGFLSSGNIIQTPNSDSGSDGCVGGSNVEAYQRNYIQFELDSITETLNAVSMSPRSEMSIRNAPSLSFECADVDSSSGSIIPIQFQKNVDSVFSWVSDSTLENLALSQTRISWKDGLVCRNDENDEFDCCPCLSDEDIDAIGRSSKQLMSCQLSQSEVDKENDLGVKSCLRSHPGAESGKNEENALKMHSDVPPILLEYEPCISAREKEKSSEDRLYACAESISTDGGDLAASCDSDWTYLQENHLFQMK